MRSASLILITALLFPACAREKPNVLFITLDTTRADHIGFISGESGVTPVLDSLVEKGVGFSNCIAVQPLTAPSHSSILTGLYPYSHGVRNNGGYVLGEDKVTLAERLKEAGYATHAVVSSFVLDSQFGFSQGFDGYDDDLRGGRRTRSPYKEISASRVAEKGLAWLRGRENDERPFFLWLHFYDAHAEYDPPEDVAAAFPDDPYSGEIHYADREMGRVIDYLRERGEIENTLIVVTADHGESLGEHGEKGHGVFVYDATTRVPLVFTGPGVPAGRRLDDVVSSTDIVPSLLELIGIRTTDRFDGQSLAGSFDGDPVAPRMAYSESFAPRINFGWSELRAARSGPIRVVEAPGREVYDLSSDPRELRNLFPESAGESRRMFAGLRQIAAGDPFETIGAPAAALDDETKKKLSALGYLTAAAPPVKGPRADPKDRIGYWETFNGAQNLMAARRYDEAIEVYSRLVEMDPENVVALSALAGAQAESGRKEAAIETHRRALEIDPSRETHYLATSRLFRGLGRFEDAETFARAAIRLQPESASGYVALAETFLEQNRFEEAETEFRKAMSIDPDSAPAVSGLGNTLNRAGRTADALKLLREGILRFPESHAITYNLAVVMERSGEIPAAFEMYRKALEIDPEHSMTLNNLGSLLDRSGRRAEAIQLIRRAHESDPENLEATYNLGALLLATGKVNEALPLLERAVQQRPSFAQAVAQYAAALAMAGRTAESIDVWTRLARSSPGAWLQVARLELGRGDRDAARRALRLGVDSGGEQFASAARSDPALRQLL